MLKRQIPKGKNFKGQVSLSCNFVTSDWKKKLFRNPVKAQSILLVFLGHPTKVSEYKNKLE